MNVIWSTGQRSILQRLHLSPSKLLLPFIIQANLCQSPLNQHLRNFSLTMDSWFFFDLFLCGFSSLFSVSKIFYFWSFSSQFYPFLLTAIFHSFSPFSLRIKEIFLSFRFISFLLGNKCSNKAGYTAQDAPSMHVFNLQK